MKNPKLFLLLCLVSFSGTLFADEFEVVSFRQDAASLIARRNPRLDINGRPCAVIKVMTDIKDLLFYSNQGIEGNVVYNQGEYWVYVQPGEKQIIIKHPDFKPLYYPIEMSIEPSNDYVLELRRKKTTTTAGLDENLVKITFRITEEDSYISKGEGAPVKVNGRVSEYQLPKGEYKFRFSKEGFESKSETILVENDKIIDISLTPGENTTRFKLPGIIIINSDPPAASVFLNGQKAGITPVGGQQILAGEYQLMVQKDLYYNYTGTFTLKEGETKELPAIVLKPKFGYLEVTTQPAGANIFLDNKLLGISPIARMKIESGNHIIRTEYSLYHTDEQQFLISDGDNKLFDLMLKPAFGTLIINSEPEGAILMIDGIEQGKTPFRNEKWSSGTYQVTLKNNLYLDETQTVIVEDGKPTEQLMVLSKNFGKISITAPGSRIYQDGTFKSSETYSANLPPAKYIFKASRDKHHDAVKEVFLTVGSNESLTLEPEPMLGSVSVFSEPASETKGAEIYISGVKQKEQTPAVIPLLIGDYQVTLKKQGYLDAGKNITIREGEAQQLSIPMQTFRGSLQQDLKKHRTQKLIWFGAAAASAGAGTYFYITANKKYDEYKTAGEDAPDIRKQVETYDILAPVFFGLSAGCLVPAIIHAVKQKKVKQRMNVAVIPGNDGMMVSMTWSF